MAAWNFSLGVKSPGFIFVGGAGGLKEKGQGGADKGRPRGRVAEDSTQICVYFHNSTTLRVVAVDPYLPFAPINAFLSCTDKCVSMYSKNMQPVYIKGRMVPCTNNFLSMGGGGVKGGAMTGGWGCITYTTFDVASAH